MSYELIERKIKTLPEEYLYEVSNYIDLLRYKIYVLEGTVDAPIPNPKRRFGILKGKIGMTADFDETPPEFAEYM